MRLKRVRLFGFKTFADRTEVNLDGGMIAVVGPNGCGKSNLVNAILWGLGEGNARQLRAQNNQDVIFSGSARRKGVGFAEVSLTFDNEDGSLPIDSTEVAITRKLNRNGDSEYSINRQRCRLRDIYDLLADSGLGRAGYAIVGQKEIDAALSASAEDRRAWIDEAAGVQRYRARKIESVRRLTSANEHLNHTRDILRELEDQREPLRKEAEDAKRYKSLFSSLREIELGLLIQELCSATQDLKGTEGALESLAVTQAKEIDLIHQLESEGSAIGGKISKLEEQLDGLRSDQQKALLAAERADANRRLAEQRLANLEELSSNLDRDVEQIAQRLTEARLEVQESNALVATETALLETLKNDAGSADSESKSLREELGRLEKLLALARKEESELLKQEAEHQHRVERLTAAQRELTGVQNDLPTLREAVEEAGGAYDAINLKVIEQDRAISESQSGRKERELAVRELIKEIAALLNEKAALEGRKRGIEATLLSHEGLTQGAKAVLEALAAGLFRGSYVPVGEAIQASIENALAIETALGASANDLICDHPDDAKVAISFLKENRAGRATFQPISLMRPQEVHTELRRVLNERGVVGRASELVECESRFRPVVESLLGRIVIVDSLDDALALSRTSGWSRLVSLDGEVVHQSGAVTGGTQSKGGYGLVQRAADVADLEDQVFEIEQKISKLEAKRDREQIADQKSVEAAAQAMQTVDALRTERDEARSFLKALEDELKSAERTAQRLTEEIAKLSSIGELANKEHDLAELETKRDATLKALATRSADAEQFENQLRERELRLQQALNRQEQAQKRLRNAVEADHVRQNRAGNLEPVRAEANAELALASRELVEASTARQLAEARLSELQSERVAQLELSLAISNRLGEGRNNLTTLTDSIHQSELRRARAESKRAASQQRLIEEYSLTEADALAQVDLHEVPDDAATLVSRLRRDLKAMGDVNLGAIDAYERITLRFDELDLQKTDIEQGIEELHESIKELDKLTRQRFTRTFEAVSAAFSQMFLRLFESGEGVLGLSDQENILDSGVDMLVTLPGKRRQPLNLLSGGERSLCAAAFLFALLSVKPSPLVVLDEVDAPLDGRNVERFIALMKSFDKIQFIIITHNPTTIESAPVWLGVTMQEPGVSTLIPARFPDSGA